MPNKNSKKKQSFEEAKKTMTLRQFAALAGAPIGREVPGVTDDLDAMLDVPIAELEQRFGGVDGFREHLRLKLASEHERELALKLYPVSPRGRA